MHKIIQLISNSLYNKNMPPFLKVHFHWMNLMKNQIIQKFQSVEILKERATRQKDSFFWPFDKKIMFNEFKMFSFRCKSYEQEIILSKNMFDYPLKLILGFLAFLAINQNIDTQLCVNVKTHYHHMNDLKLDYSFFLT